MCVEWGCRELFMSDSEYIGEQLLLLKGANLNFSFIDRTSRDFDLTREKLAIVVANISSAKFSIDTIYKKRLFMVKRKNP